MSRIISVEIPHMMGHSTIYSIGDDKYKVFDSSEKIVSISQSTSRDGAIFIEVYTCTKNPEEPPEWKIWKVIPIQFCIVEYGDA